MYLTLLPLLGAVPFRVVRVLAGVLALAGAYGLAGVLRLVWTEWRAMDVRSAMWLLAAAAIAILSLRTAIALRFYWMFSGNTATLLAPAVRSSVVIRCTALSNSALCCERRYSRTSSFTSSYDCRPAGFLSSTKMR